ncbi:MAG: HAD-IIA family hydrolase [Chloroflexota bacterium]
MAADPSLRRALDGVRAFLLDLDGVIVLAGEAIPGAAAALAELERRAIPYRIVTNTSLVSRATLAEWGARIGAPVPAERFQSALSATAADTAARYPDEALYVLASDDARSEFGGQHLLSHAQAATPGATAAAVVIGDSPEELTYDNLNRAFRLVRRGAELIGMHRNAWWLTSEGPTLDSGAYVAGLEFATQRSARILGKPSPRFYSLAVAALKRDVLAAGGPRLTRREVAMVGDDVRTDIAAGQRAGLRAIFVRSGKHGEAELAAWAGRGRSGGTPDGIAASLAEVVAALD